MSNYVSLQTVAAAAYAVYSWDVQGALYLAFSAYGDYQRGNARIDGPRLSDTSFGSSQYGEPIVMAYGSVRLAGQVWWASEKRGTTTTTGGKGGPEPEVSTTNYSIDLLIGLTDDRAVRISRVWSNGRLVWTRLPGATEESLANSDGTNLWRRMTFYAGSDTQLPDPTYEAAVGSLNAPAYRGRSYVFIEGLQLGQSGVLPQLSFEVAVSGTYAIGTVEAGPSQVSPGYLVGTPAAVGSTVMRVAVAQFDSFFANRTIWEVDFDMLAGTATVAGSYEVQEGSNERNTLGTSDRPVLVTGSLSYARVYRSGGLFALINTTADLAIGSMRWALRGDTMVVGSSDFNGFNTRRLFRYELSNSSNALQQSAPLPTPVHSIVILGGAVYAIEVRGSPDGTRNSLYRLDLSTLALQETIPGPELGDTRPLLFALESELGYISGNTGIVYTLRDGEWINLGTLPSTYRQGSGDAWSACVVGGLLTGSKLSAHPGGSVVTWKAPITVTPGTQTVANVVDSICRRAGMPAGSWDTTDLAAITRPVRSFPIGRVTTGRAMLEQLAAVFFFEPALRDKLYFRRIGRAPSMTIAFGDLAAAIDRADEQPLALSLASDIEQPPQLAIRYANLLADYQAGTEYSDRMLATQAAVNLIEVAIGMRPDEARAVVDAMVAQRVVGSVTVPLRLPISYTQLDAGDVVTVVDEDGRVYTLRLRKRTDERGVLTFEAVRDESSAVPGTGITDSTQQPAGDVEAYTDMVAALLDIPLLRDADDFAGWYVKARGEGTPWPGGVVQVSPDDVTFSTAAEITESGVLGVTTTALGAWGGGGWDEINSVTVSVAPGTASSSSRAAMDLDVTINTWIIGDEVIRARVATQVSAGVYRLTGLLRGLLGTEWAIGLHASSERAVQLAPAGMRRISETLDRTGVTQYVRAVSFTKTAADVEAVEFVNTNRALRPLAPWGLRVQEQLGQDLLISWGRRSRLAAVFLSPTGIPLGEAAEAYAVRVYLSGSPSVLLRTIDAATTSAVYTRAQQVEDGVSAGTEIEVEVVQISQAVGEGYPARVLARGAAQSLPQISRITLAGTFAAGAQLRAVVGAETFTYTTVSGDATLAGAAAALAALIDASATYNATSSGAVITVTGALGVPFSLAATVVAGDNTVTVSVTQQAAAASVGTSYLAYFTIANLVTGVVEPIPAGVRFTVRVDKPVGTQIGSFSYTTTGTSTRYDVHAGLQEACNESALAALGYAYGVTFLSGAYVGSLLGPLGVTDVFSVGSAQSPYSLGGSLQQPGSASIPSDRPQLTEVTFAGTVTAGWRYRITLGGTAFTYTAVGGDDIIDVAQGLAALVDASASYSAAVGSPATGKVFIAGAPVVDYTATAAILPSTITISSALIQAAQ